uniref:Ras-related protein Rab-1 n=1 Tax=Bicosoecida sp. CB-2014 TaxID=1486930 RepID=A0A7S1G9L4_9STRA|mmetsp:Transcript_21492/g.75623  ORF Transcript_21492/g.75623 Transcript_21492/m.75623 type:complete len:219 (+) Transcript_21492:220-876(+)
MASRGEAFDLQIKLLTIGDSGVGKTCLLLRYANASFSPTFITTIGIDFKIKTIDLGGKRVKLQIWDTAGQERFRTITTSYFRGAQGILLVYDITDRGSFENINNWVRQIAQYGDKHVNKILIGNKCDMEGDRAVTKQEGEELAKQHNMPFFETSAKTDVGVGPAFSEIASQVMKRLMAEDGGGGARGGSGGGGVRVEGGRGRGGGNNNSKDGGCCSIM